MREWPSIVPGAPEDYYIVVNHYGRFGPAFAETSLDRADYEITIADPMTGQHSDPLRAGAVKQALAGKGLGAPTRLPKRASNRSFP